MVKSPYQPLYVVVVAVSIISLFFDELELNNSIIISGSIFSGQNKPRSVSQFISFLRCMKNAFLFYLG